MAQRLSPSSPLTGVRKCKRCSGPICWCLHRGTSTAHGLSSVALESGADASRLSDIHLPWKRSRLNGADVPQVQPPAQNGVNIVFTLYVARGGWHKQRPYTLCAISFSFLSRSLDAGFFRAAHPLKPRLREKAGLSKFLVSLQAEECCFRTNGCCTPWGSRFRSEISQLRWPCIRGANTRPFCIAAMDRTRSRSLRLKRGDWSRAPRSRKVFMEYIFRKTARNSSAAGRATRLCMSSLSRAAIFHNTR